MGKRIDRENYEQFLKEANESEIDLLVHREKTISFLKKTCVGLFILAAGGIGSNFALFPLKENTPYLLVQDKATGAVESLTILTPEELTKMDSTVDYFVRLYVKNRESYSAKNIQTYYDTTIEMSDQEQGRAWDRKYFEGKNAIDKVLGDSVSIEVNVTDVIADYKNNKAVVRFEKKFVYDNKEPVTEYWSADVSWYFDLGVMKVFQRAANPLGMKVDDYRSSQEVRK
ncbi:type IV secretion system protein [Cronobacter sakazakii]|nr:type IV secretion system protein [Cronobacter sakazakii]